MTRQASKYWLAKSEPDSFSWADLLACPKRTTAWDGVRNYQARNFMRDGFRLGDCVFFYQSSCSELGVVGMMRVVKEAYPDPTQFDPTSPYFDLKATRQTPRWLAVDLQAALAFAKTVTRQTLQQEPAWSSLPLFARHSRLSVQPVPLAAARRLLALAGRPSALS